MRYILDNEIIISENSLNYNVYTWTDGLSKDEIPILEFFYNIIPKSGDFTIVDIGAQSGLFSLMSKFTSNTIWHSFEPELTNYNCLLENISLNDIKNIKTYNIGLGSKNEIKILNVNPTHRGLNTFGEYSVNFDLNLAEKQSIEVKTLDSLFLNTKIDLIKIDTEGSEHDILIGGIEVIKKYKPKILMEYHEPNLKQFNKTKKDIDEIIDKLNYQITWSQPGNIFIESK
jgi:FkbM family methyltransferase